MRKIFVLLFFAMFFIVKISAQFTLAPLPYAYNALEPFIDEATMKLHHDVHHQAYVNNLNKALANYPELAGKSLEALITDINKLPGEVKTAIRNNGGGHYNHQLFWTLLTPPSQSKFGGAIEEAIVQQFGSFESFKTAFEQAAVARFGSGWAWLMVQKDGKLKIISTPNQDNSLMDIAENHGIPILALDVWEHAYYLKYQAKRADYAQAFWNIVNWDEVNRQYLKAATGK